MSRSAVPKTGEGIKSGMLISIDGNGEWVKGVPNGKVAYVAFHDQTDTDVVSSGKLLGLSCAGDYVMRSGWFDETGGAISDGDYLIAGTGGLAGYIVKASSQDSAEDKIGIAEGVSDFAGQISGVTKDENGKVNLLVFISRWMPNQTAAAYAP